MSLAAQEQTKRSVLQADSIRQQAENIRQLATIATAHGDRITSLERKTGT